MRSEREKMFTGGYIESEKGRKIKRTETQRYKGISANRKRSSNQRETREVTLPPCGLLGYCPYIHKPCCFFTPVGIYGVIMPTPAAGVSELKATPKLPAGGSSFMT